MTRANPVSLSRVCGMAKIGETGWLNTSREADQIRWICGMRRRRRGLANEMSWDYEGTGTRCGDLLCRSVVREQLQQMTASKLKLNANTSSAFDSSSGLCWPYLR
jgi:hypothetical protein